MTVTPSTVSAANPGSLTFSYHAPARGVTMTGAVTLVVPDGWTPPSVIPGTAGFTTSQPDPLQISGMRITVAGISLSPGQPLAITYRPTAAPRAAGRWLFVASARPAASSAMVTLTASPVVLVSLSSPVHISVPLLAALLAVGFAAVAAAGRFLRHRRHRRTVGDGGRLLRHQPAAVPGASVHTVAHAGPPGPVSVQPTGHAATHSVTVRPVYVPRVTTIEQTPSGETRSGEALP